MTPSGAAWASPASSSSVLMAIPYVDRHHSGIGRWFAKSRRTGLHPVDAVCGRRRRADHHRRYFRGPNWGWFTPWTMPEGNAQ